jgi:hypothetical protein
LTSVPVVPVVPVVFWMFHSFNILYNYLYINKLYILLKVVTPPILIGTTGTTGTAGTLREPEPRRAA